RPFFILRDRRERTSASDSRAAARPSGLQLPNRRISMAQACGVDETRRPRWDAGARLSENYHRRREYPAHHLAWLYKKGNWCSQMIDHRDLDPSNNRWTNLRRATRSQNNANRCVPPNNACGLKGVSPDRDRWRATIRKNRRRYHLGKFVTP